MIIGHPRSGPAGLGGGPSSGSYHPSSTWLFVRYMGRNKSKPNRGAVSRARSSLPACFRRQSPGPLRLARLSSATSLEPPKGFWVGDGRSCKVGLAVTQACFNSTRAHLRIKYACIGDYISYTIFSDGHRQNRPSDGPFHDPKPQDRTESQRTLMQ